MTSLLGQNVFVAVFGTGIVVKESIIGGAVKCTVESNSLIYNGLRAEFNISQLTPTCSGLKK